MTAAELDKEIKKRRASILHAERTVMDARGAAYRSDDTEKALHVLLQVLGAERAVVSELEKYRTSHKDKP